MNVHPNTTPASPSLASPIFDALFDSIETLTTSVTASVVPTLETTTVTEVALGYHRNQQYSITAMTTSTGAVTERYAYTAYGQPTILNASGTVLTSSAVGNRYTYTGREWDETLGLHHFRARWMSPLAGRFLGRDPIGYAGSEWHLVEPLGSSPLKNFDPFGKEPTNAEKLAECERLKRLYESSAHVKPETCKAKNWTISITCATGFMEGGTAHCDLKRKNHVRIRINYQTYTTLEQIAGAFLHELQHASDFCECGCSRFDEPKYPDNTEEKKRAVCSNLLCTEVRAIGVDGSCDGKPDDERRACIKKIIEDFYLKHYGCPADLVEGVMEKCYVPEGASPPTFPELI